MKDRILDMFPVGYHNFHEDPRLNANLNMMYSMGVFRRDELEDIGKRVHSFEEWITEFTRLGKGYEEAQDHLRAAFAYYNAMFFTSGSVVSSGGMLSKRELYEKSRSMFDMYYSADEDLRYEHIPFGANYLPVYCSTGEAPRGTIVFFGGYDSIIQEFLGLCKYFRSLGYDIYFFEGPGQGEVFMREGLKMTHEWEHCTGAVLDHFGLSDVTVIGISLGGYLASRAAAYDKRISRVVMCDLIYDFYGALLGKMGDKAKILDDMTKHPKSPMWMLVNKKLKKNFFTNWLVDQGCAIFENVNTPCEYFNHIKRFNTREISPMITPDALVLAGTSDLYTIYYDEQIKALTNARSVTGRLFTEEESADHHCQIGNIPLLLTTITDWIAEKER
ncbi:MAG: hypothetical protein ILP19_05505 [Oscillospiraceae bacterium]|nr:hypothetical protein [Oscillospiraceae bacterium]